MAKKKPTQTKSIRNRRASYDYALEDGFVVGIQLSGRETKALRMGHGHLRGAYVTIKDNELWLLNATINSTNNILIDETEQTRTRKLLARRKQIDELIAAKQQGRTIVPIEILTKGRYIKLRIAAGKGKKHYDKRHTIKERDVARDVNRVLTR